MKIERKFHIVKVRFIGRMSAEVTEIEGFIFEILIHNDISWHTYTGEMVLDPDTLKKFDIPEVNYVGRLATFTLELTEIDFKRLQQTHDPKKDLQICELSQITKKTISSDCLSLPDETKFTRTFTKTEYVLELKTCKFDEGHWGLCEDTPRFTFRFALSPDEYEELENKLGPGFKVFRIMELKLT